MKKFTVIYNKCWQAGSHWHTLTNIQRVTAPSIEVVMKSEYGEQAVFIFDGWPLLQQETSENDYNLTVVELTA